MSPKTTSDTYHFLPKAGNPPDLKLTFLLYACYIHFLKASLKWEENLPYAHYQLITCMSYLTPINAHALINSYKSNFLMVRLSAVEMAFITKKWLSDALYWFYRPSKQLWVEITFERKTGEIALSECQTDWIQIWVQTASKVHQQTIIATALRTGFFFKKRGIPVKKEESPYTPFKMQQIWTYWVKSETIYSSKFWSKKRKSSKKRKILIPV